MKMSEFTTKSFLGNAGAAENSYILINYEDNTTQRPVTYKASLQEIGKAIANDQKLYKKTQNGAITTNVSQGAYVNTAAENFASTGAVTAAVSGLASTGYVTNAISTATNGLLDINDVRQLFINDSIATTGDIAVAVNGLASTGYVDAAVENAGGATGGQSGDMPVYANSSTGEIRWYDVDNPDSSDTYPVIQTNGKPIVVYDSTNGVGYFMTPSASEITPLDLGGATDLTNYAYVTTSQNGSQSLDYADGTYTHHITADMVGAASTGDLMGVVYHTITNAGHNALLDSSQNLRGYIPEFSNAASTGDLVNHLYYDVGQSTVLVKNANGNTVDFGDFASKAYIEGHFISQGYVLSEIDGILEHEFEFGNEYSTHLITYDSGTSLLYFCQGTASDPYPIPNIAYIDTSDNKPCIRNYQGDFQGFLSAT